MAQHISRKELKKDEFRETLSHGAEVVVSHQRQVWILAALAVVVVGSVLGWRFYTQRQTARASAALTSAMNIYQAPVRGVDQPTFPGETTYASAKAKFTDAAKEFAQIADQFPRTRPGQLARYYAALSQEQLGNYNQAEEGLRSLESGRDAGLAALSRFQLAQIYDKTGKQAEAVQLYNQLISAQNIFVPKAVVMLALADHYAKNDPAQAEKLYQQVKTEFPNSQAAQEADQHLQLLPAKG